MNKFLSYYVKKIETGKKNPVTESEDSDTWGRAKEIY